MRLAIVTAVLGLAISTQAIAEEACWVSYDDFERMVPHSDLMTCPKAEMDADVGFCRLSVVGDTVTIYQFKFGEDDQLCLERGRGYELESFLKRYGSRYTLPE